LSRRIFSREICEDGEGGKNKNGPDEIFSKYNLNNMPEDEQKIKCPKCGESISIDSVLTSQVETKVKKELALEQKVREEELERQKEDLRMKEFRLSEKIKAADIDVNEKVAARIAEEKVLLWKKALTEAEKSKSAEMKILEGQLENKERKLSEANAEALQLRQERRKLEADKQEFELKIQRQMDEERKIIEEEASRKAAEEQQWQIAQLKKQISDANVANENLKRKLEQGSQQTQGEVMELALEEILKLEFPADEIVPVPKGVNGADIVQKVCDRSGRLCGQIVWESKKTKNWTEGWIPKLKDDQRAIKAELAVIVSAVLPGDTKGFAYRDGVWVCDIRLTVALATALRSTLEAVNREKMMAVGKNEKMDVIYSYLTGVEFRQRVEAIVEAFSNMKNGLEKEKMAYQKIWSERDKQIQKVINNTVGLYGDLSGLAPLQEIKLLELGEGEDDDE